MKNVGLYDWKLGTAKPVSWIMIHAPANGGGKSQDMHSALHLGIILSGKHVGKYGNTGLELNSSNIYLTSPWEPHCTLPGSSERDILLINLDDSTLEKFFFIGREKLEKLFFMPPVERMQCINQIPEKTLLQRGDIAGEANKYIHARKAQRRQHDQQNSLVLSVQFHLIHRLSFKLSTVYSPFFKKIWLSITKFERYPEMATEGVGKAISYLFKLMLV